MFKKLSKSRFIRNSIFVLALILSIGATSIFGAKNSMIKVGKNEVVAIKSSLIENKDLLFVEVDAHNWAKDEDFFEDIGKKMEFPRSLWNHESWCLDEFEDLMRDLVWTENKSIVMIINNLSEFNYGNSEVDQHILAECFKNVILPFWEGIPGTHSVVDCYPCMKPKEFNVYYT